MCGILFLASPSPQLFRISSSDLDAINRRGPNWHSSVSLGSEITDRAARLPSKCPNISDRSIDESIGQLYFYLHASVLQLRGAELVRQPVMDLASGGLLAWNGELFGSSSGALPLADSDTLIISQQLSDCGGDEERIFRVLNGSQGPFAFVYCDRTRHAVYFGRDRCGRRSLTWTRTITDPFILSSVLSSGVNYADSERYGEVSPHGMFRMENKAGQLKFTFRSWTSLWGEENLHNADDDLEKFCSVNSTTLLEALEAAPENRVISRELHGLTDYPALLTADTPHGEYLEKLLEDTGVAELVQQLRENLNLSVKLRCECSVAWCKNCTAACVHAKTAVLFSGGIDSMLVALLAHLYIPTDDPIDLLNVTFVPDDKPEFAALAPDRITGLDGYHQLCSAFPIRRWNLVLIDVRKSEMNDVRQSRLWQLIAPQSTVLDCSLATVLWFASRGTGILASDSGLLYTTPARILLSGLGADELLGGYARHRTKFRVGGENALLAEMDMDLRRIGSRNCGRDDRVISDHGREARYPFLDENILAFVSKLPVRLRCRLDLPRGLGDKLLLRLLVWQMGFPVAALLEKRAMQFGSRIAKIDQSKKGSDAMNCRES